MEKEILFSHNRWELIGTLANR